SNNWLQPCHTKNQREGREVFSRFQTGRAGTLWNYASLLEIYRERAPQTLKPLVDRLERAVEGFAGSGPSASS
ncbi:MAG: hypothetical protein O7F08_09145, partial [Deltaproteobacteria bacterium]|nr:hypothetical protein [Deltaproteobacteria bacterium]